MTDTYPMPPDGWVCFHCGERFTKPGTARLHFGTYPWARPACQITAAQLRAELMDYRKLEERFGPLDERNRKLYGMDENPHPTPPPNPLTTRAERPAISPYPMRKAAFNMRPLAVLMRGSVEYGGSDARHP